MHVPHGTAVGRTGRGARYCTAAHGVARRGLYGGCRALATRELHASRRCHEGAVPSTHVSSSGAAPRCRSASSKEDRMQIQHAMLHATDGAYDRPRRVDESTLDPDALIAAGAGYAALTRDGVPVHEAAFGDFEHP